MDNLIHLFIDESGKPELLDLNYRYFILTGIEISDEELETISGYFSFIKRKYNLPKNTPFHTYDLLENSSSSLKLSENEIKFFIKSMHEFLELIPLNASVIITDKKTFRKKFRIEDKNLKGSPENKKRNAIIYFISSLYLLSEFSRHIEKENLLGAIHADSRKYSDNQLLKAFLDIKEPNLKGLPNFLPSTAKRLCSIEFADKTALSAGLELADFISFTIFACKQKRLHKLHLEKIWKLIKNNRNIKILNLKDDLTREYI